MPDKKAIEQALAKITDTAVRNNHTCWAERLPDDAFEFLTYIEELERDPTQTVSRKVASEQFATLFNLDISSKRLSTHLVKTCSCHKRRTY